MIFKLKLKINSKKLKTNIMKILNNKSEFIYANANCFLRSAGILLRALQTPTSEVKTEFHSKNVIDSI